MTDASSSRNSAQATYEIKLRNHKKTEATISLVEHVWPYGGVSITEKSQPYTKVDATTIRFDVPVAADGESTVTYTVHYTW